jgi:formylglycine-generating enzyme required for sulfatase activity
MGEYAIAVSRTGYVTQNKRIKVKYGDNTQRITLARAYGRLNVRATPSNSYIDVAYAETESVPFKPNMRLPAGKVIVTVRAMGYRTKTQSINLKPAGQTLSVNLKKVTAKVGSELTDTLPGGGKAPVMVVMPPGQYRMGDPAGGQSERPVRVVQLTQPFAVSKYEVSIEDFLKYTQNTGNPVPKKLAAALAQQELTEQSPMVYVSHQQATKYARWLSEQTKATYRIPTEAEWEYVARAGSETDYFFGTQPADLCQYANVADQTIRKQYREWEIIDCIDDQVGPVKRGQYRPNAFGLYDTHGSVSEWVADCGMPDYEKGSRDGTKQGQGAGCSSHGHRGGSWDSGPEDTKNSYRKTAAGGNVDRGIRLLREL